MCYGLIAAALAAPQLLCFTFKQAASGSFLRLHWNWVNDKDSWLWFYVKNMGLIFLLMPPALACARRESRLFFAGGALLWLICELVVFQPNLYDNNKLIFVSYALMCGLTAEFMAKVWTALREGALRRAAPVLASIMPAEMPPAMRTSPPQSMLLAATFQSSKTRRPGTKRSTKPSRATKPSGALKPM